MNNIQEFDYKSEYHRFLLRQAKQLLGSGAEGNVYLTNNNKAIKEIYNPNIEYIKGDILLHDDLPLKSFLFPQKLYLWHNRIIGYTTDFFPNIFKNYDGDILDIDLDALIEAGYKMIDDIRILTEYKYVMYDLTFNIMFDGKTLKAIDTLGYYKDEFVTLDKNIDLLRCALIETVSIHDEYWSMHDKHVYTRTIKKAFKTR